MSYSISVSGHTDSKKAEAEVLGGAANFVEKVGAKGYFSFNGQHFSVSSAPADDAVAKARQAVAAYNLEADADDQVGAS